MRKHVTSEPKLEKSMESILDEILVDDVDILHVGDFRLFNLEPVFPRDLNDTIVDPYIDSLVEFFRHHPRTIYSVMKIHYDVPKHSERIFNGLDGSDIFLQLGKSDVVEHISSIYIKNINDTVLYDKSVIIPAQNYIKFGCTMFNIEDEHMFVHFVKLHLITVRDDQLYLYMIDISLTVLSLMYHMQITDVMGYIQKYVTVISMYVSKTGKVTTKELVDFFIECFKNRISEMRSFHVDEKFVLKKCPPEIGIMSEDGIFEGPEKLLMDVM
jgi:hypothetical protein